MSCWINCEQTKPAEIPRYVIMQKKIRIIVEIFSYWYTCNRERLEELSVSWEFEHEQNLWFFRIVSHRIIPYYEIVKKTYPVSFASASPRPFPWKKTLPLNPSLLGMTFTNSSHLKGCLKCRVTHLLKFSTLLIKLKYLLNTELIFQGV